MANYIYPAFEEARNQGLVNLSTGSVVFLVVTSAETYVSTDEFQSDLTAENILATSAALDSKTFTGATVDAADPLVSAVTGTPAAVIAVLSTGVAATSRLISYHEVTSGALAGADIALVLSASGIMYRA